MHALKAVVLEKNGSQLTVLTSDGSFQKIRHKGAVEIGSEIEIPTAKAVPIWRIGASVAAIFLMVFMGIFGWNIFQPGTAVAMLSVDINPSLQLTLDRKGQVLELQSLNPDAEQLLSGLALKGEPWKEALTEIIEQSVNLNYLNPQHTWVIVGYSPITPEYNLPSTEINTDIITERVEGAVAGKGIDPKVAVYSLTAEEQVQAQEKGLTLGEYALVNTAQKAGVPVEPQKIKKTEDRVRLLEKPEIQEQMKKEMQIKEDEKKAPAVVNPQIEKKEDSGPTKKESFNRYEEKRDEEKRNVKSNENKWLFKPNEIIPSGQSEKSFRNSDHDKEYMEKHQEKDEKRGSGKEQSSEARKNGSRED